MNNRKDKPVGFGSPPLSTRFKPGVSGNLSGRPKRIKSLKAELIEELEELTSVIENGRDAKVTKARAIAKAVVRQAASGNLRAITALISVFARESAGTETASDAAEDGALFDEFVDREIRRRAHASSSNPDVANTPEHKE